MLIGLTAVAELEISVIVKASSSSYSLDISLTNSTFLSVFISLID